MSASTCAPGGDAVAVLSISIPPLPNVEPSTRPVPAEQPRRCLEVAHRPRRPMGSTVVAAVLDSDQAGFGPAEIAPLRRPFDQVAASVDMPEEVVRRQEHEVPSDVAVPLDRVVLMCRHVLVVTREHDQPVRPCERPAVETVEVRVREKVDRMSVPREPVQKRQVVAAEVERNPAVQERSCKPNGVVRPVRVPRVALAVSVVVAKVVGLPRERRKDHCDGGFTKTIGPQHERREADEAAGRLQPRRVQAARPRTDPDGGRGAVDDAADEHRFRDGHALQLVVSHGRRVLGADMDDLHRDA